MKMEFAPKQCSTKTLTPEEEKLKILINITFGWQPGRMPLVTECEIDGECWIEVPLNHRLSRFKVEFDRNWDVVSYHVCNLVMYALFLTMQTGLEC